MIEITIADLNKTLEAIDRLQSTSWLAKELRSLIPAVGQVNKAQFDRNKQLPYSSTYVGKLKPSKRFRAGGPGDQGYAIDTLALYSDALFSFDVDENSLTNFSDLEYAAYQADLMESKGSSFYADDDEYFQLLQIAIESGLSKTWRVGEPNKTT